MADSVFDLASMRRVSDFDGVETTEMGVTCEKRPDRSFGGGVEGSVLDFFDGDNDEEGENKLSSSGRLEVFIAVRKRACHRQVTACTRPWSGRLFPPIQNPHQPHSLGGSKDSVWDIVRRGGIADCDRGDQQVIRVIGTP